ncbi:MAG TPA: TIGR03087 family PEP-CTERM/XrtA system glycosyltransferase [Phycisphaerae bacterium]|jgi:sugar transferase (PEP-CTERM/EpsH1 system associated)|nr:TIGR03087 family PEP-CTERM/XrtA system glycosyltransferase [Phycisphaerae bacterium]HOB72992.1 TIGR03087 family PEP-CTERM/XrtA system glycosyltransferase [Phycisphaerae bacterium]HOJ52959.1 TIGR03087 family PEP-CTERM/XrtA system glycosyltransferase [Phycisphaerae bacterium]HOL24696.1 TIGR03087 family PEP-CTERM/XrtA system glycosyltransferase [Phycisphaerae bacterium]HPP19232.1 TIGR03087 family PEP-CTERM/XrtA system glycosyltransferase [Phycisphaerae bacterium]
MKLLVLIHRLPCPPDRGSKIRAAAELRFLARRHEVWCAGFLDAEGRAARRQARESLAEWRKLCRAVVAVPLRRPVAAVRAMHRLLTGSTATEGYFASRALEHQVLQWGRNIDFDAVLAFSSSMAPLALRVPAGRHVLDLVDLDSRKWIDSACRASWPMSWVYRTEGERLARRERKWMQAFDANIFVNEREAALLSEDDTADPDGLGPRVHVIETGVCPEADIPARDGEHLGLCDEGLPEEANIGFIGAMDYPPNVEGAVWFARSILPLIRIHRPDAAFWIIGRSSTRAVRELHDGMGIHVTGAVPSVGPYLGRLRVSVAPLRLARGVQTKVLVAMAAGIPCVVTPCVAEGIGARVGREILVASSPERFARAVRMLLSDRDRAEAMGEAGRQFVHRRYNPDAGLARLELLLKGYEPAPTERPVEPVADLCRAC